MAGLMQTIQQAGYTNKPVSRATLVNAVTSVAHVSHADNVDEWYSNGRTLLQLPTTNGRQLHAPRNLNRDHLSRRNAGFFVPIVLYMGMPLYLRHANTGANIGK